MTRVKTSGEEEVKSHEEYLALFKKGLKFTEELIAENERLRLRVANLESENETLRRHGDGDGLARELKQKLREIEDEKNRLLSSYKKIETLNRDYQARNAELEEEDNNLANLYTASYQLHSAVTFREVVQVVSEIVINLVGVSQFAIYLLDVPSGTLHPIAAEGQELSAIQPIPLGSGTAGAATRDRQRYLAPGTPTDGPLAVVPLSTPDIIVGCIVIDELLVQKQGLHAVDNELLNLLAVHAATALLSGLLHDQVGDGGAAEALTIDHARKLLG